MMSVRTDTFFSKREILELRSALRLSSDLETRDLIHEMDSCIEKQLVHPLCEVVEVVGGLTNVEDGMSLPCVRGCPDDECWGRGGGSRVSDGVIDRNDWGCTATSRGEVAILWSRRGWPAGRRGGQG